MEIKGNTISEVWSSSIKSLLSHGQWTTTDRGLRALELCNMQLHICNPLALPRIPENYQFSSKFIEEYAESLISNKQAGESIYNRLYTFGNNDIDQIESIINVLKNSHTSRRAVVTTWQPDYDLFSTHPPCMIYLQFLVRNYSLCLVSVFRSNDAWLAAPVDILALTNLQKNVADELELEVGFYNQISVSYHLYEMDFLIAQKKYGII